MRQSIVATALLLGLAGCASDVVRTPSPVAPIATAPAPTPAAPEGYVASLIVPQRDATGRFRTINYGLSAAGSVWHLRSALNVAALGCRGLQEAQLIADYNRLLVVQKAVLARALKTLSDEQKALQGKDWQTGQDRQMTRLYNFFALPQAHDAFCTAASAVAAAAIATPPGGLEEFAPTALASLEAPFTNYFARVERYQSDLAAWQQRQGAGAARLAYADLDQLIAWVPDRRSRYADARRW